MDALSARRIAWYCSNVTLSPPILERHPDIHARFEQSNCSEHSLDSFAERYAKHRRFIGCEEHHQVIACLAVELAQDACESFAKRTFKKVDVGILGLEPVHEIDVAIPEIGKKVPE